MVTADPIRIVFFGTPEFAVPSLDALLESRHRINGVVTQPDRPRGRGQKVSSSPVKTRAEAVGLPVLQPDRLSAPDFLSSLQALRADLGVVAAYGKILTNAVLGVPRLGLVNVHASLLPKYRGAAPVHRAIIAGETETGVTIMRVVKALDAGPMLATARRPIGPDETSGEVERSLAVLGAELLVATIDRLVRGQVVDVPQDDSQATYAHRLTREDGAVDWSLPASRLHDLVRGLHPWPHAFTFLGRDRFILHRSAVWNGPDPKATAGTILLSEGDLLTVATGAGVLRIVQIQAEGKRPMTARELLAGHHELTPGARFHPTPT